MKRSPLKRHVGLKRSPLRRVSKKRRAEAKAYTKLRHDFLIEHPFCQASFLIFGTPFVPSEDVHHKELRGANYLKPETWLAVARKAHNWIHANSRAARVLGLLK